MAFFDDVGKKIAQTSQSAAQKAKNMAENVKLNGQITDEEKRINNSFMQIGKAYYESYGNEPDQLFAQMIAEINDSRAKIAFYSEQIEQLKGIVRCPNCGGEVPYGAPFCSLCGSPIGAATATAPAANGMVCEKCGAPVSADTVFCTTCGNKIANFVAVAPIDQAAPAGQIQDGAPAEMEATSKCPGCGYVLPEGAAFCVNCGCKIGG